MFENELKSLGKISEKIEGTQQNIIKNSVSFEDALIDIHRKVFDSQNLTIGEQVEKIGGAGKLFVGFMILMLPIFFAGEKPGIMSWLVLIFLGSCFHIFPVLHTYIHTSNTQKLRNVNWLLLYLVTGITWVPILGIIFGEFFWYLLIPWWSIFLLWCCVTLAIQLKIEEKMGSYRDNLNELQKIHSSTIFNMSLDFYSLTIYPQQVIKIRDSIEKVSTKIQQLSELQGWIYASYQKWFTTFWCVLFPRKLKGQLESFFQNESNQLLIYTNIFSQDLNLWTERHKMELGKLEESIDGQKVETMLPEGKAVLELSQDRILRLTRETDAIKEDKK